MTYLATAQVLGQHAEVHYTFEADNMQDARIWIQNHGDMSYIWNVKELIDDK